MKIVWNIIAVLAGVAVGSAVNMTIVVVGPTFIPPPAGVNVADMEALRASTIKVRCRTCRHQRN